MKKILIFISFLLLGYKVYPQKPTIDTSAIFNWPTVSSGKISANGDYVIYIINNQPRNNSTLVIQAVKKKWTKSIVSVSYYNLTDQDCVVYQIKDTLNIFNLQSKKLEKTKDVKNYKVSLVNNRTTLTYQLTDGSLIVHDLVTNLKRKFKGILSYSISQGGTFVLKKADGVYWASLESITERLIYSGQAENIIMDQSGNQAAFLTYDNGQKAIQYFQHEMKSSELLMKGAVIDRLLISNIDQFTSDGNSLLFHLVEESLPKPDPGAVMVDVWSWTDARLQSQQLNELNPRLYLASVELQTRKIKRLQYENETINTLNFRSDLDNYAIEYIQGVSTEANWNPLAGTKYYLPLGQKKKQIPFAPTASFASTKFLGYDSVGQICFYDLTENKTYRLTCKIPLELKDEDGNEMQRTYELGLAGILPNMDGVIVYDRYDIWKVSFDTTKTPICLTRGIGRKKNIVFRIVIESGHGIGKINDTGILSASDLINKNNGFYELSANGIKKMSMDAYNYDDAIVEAKKQPVYLVARESTKQSKNYFVTRDFKTFIPISNIYPETKYNWLTSELVTFTTPGNEKLQGVLYKPENFDPSKKKYPCIIHYYDKKSLEKNKFHIPNLMIANINVPYLVSKGYIVFTPDIVFKTGETGKSALQAIDGATNYLCKQAFIDSTKLGLMGHSFGGFETNYIVTHTKFHYAAAASYAGFSDLISLNGSLMKDGISAQFWAEIHSLRIGGSLWEKKEQYMDNSPVLFTPNVTCPLLLMSNQNDKAVNFEQGIELFTALRRLQKRAWLLQYDGEGHALNNTNAQIDLTFRTEQFFDHYLMDKPAPLWMLDGIPASRKGIDTGLELDTKGRTPSDNSLKLKTN